MPFNKTGSFQIIAGKVESPNDWNDFLTSNTNLLYPTDGGGVRLASSEAMAKATSAVATIKDPDQWIFVHATIMASVDLEDGSEYLLKRASEKWINDNGDCWERQQLLNDFGTFRNASVYVAHNKDPIHAKGKVFDVVAREMDDTVLVDVLFGIQKRHTDLVANIEAGILNTRTAKRYLELARDPLGPLTRRYEAMIGQIGRPVAVFIDDLDRCDAKFVVELLQNIQTLFRGAPVLYVVAADRGWICTSYEQIYAPYCEPIAEPGHSLGYMFLEKIFQLSIEVPSLGGAQRNAFWGHLLKTRDQPTPEDRDAIDAEVTGRLDKATTEQEVIGIVDEVSKQGPTHAAIAGARAFKHMQSKALTREREHFLAGYADLLEANPRAMKRLLNAYGFRRGFDIQSPDRSDPDALVRWTILENRWPVLADHLAGRSAGRGDGEIIDALKKDSDVLDVAKGLTYQKLRTIAGAPTRSRDGKLLPGRTAKKA